VIEARMDVLSSKDVTPASELKLRRESELSAFDRETPLSALRDATEAVDAVDCVC